MSQAPELTPSSRDTAQAALPRVNGGAELFKWGCGGLVLMVLALTAAIVYLMTRDDPPAEVIVERPSAPVVAQIRDLARLETTSYHMERVVNLRRSQSSLGGLIQATDAILLVAAADVSAGVDLTKLRDGDIVIDEQNRRAYVLLPPPEIFSARLDNDRTYVYTRETDLLAARDEDLETRARQRAEETLREGALEAGILDRAGQNAQVAIETLVRALGYTQVTIEFRTDEGPALAPEPTP